MLIKHITVLVVMKIESYLLPLLDGACCGRGLTRVRTDALTGLSLSLIEVWIDFES